MTKHQFLSQKFAYLPLLSLFLLCLSLSTARADDFASHVQRTDPPQKLPAMVFEDDNHVQHTLADYKGRFVLLNFWASWCGPCVEEMPSLDALQKKIGPEQLAIIPVSEDRGDGTVGVFYQLHAIKHLPVAIDHPGTIPYTIHLQGLPTTLLINPQGLEIARVEGGVDWSSPEAVAFIRARLSAASSP